MRKLNAKQKKMLKEWYNKHKDLPGLGVFDVASCDEFPGELYQQIFELNEFEIFNQCVDRYISDLAWGRE